MAGTFTCLHIHAIFSTKHREPTLHEELRADVYRYIGGIASNLRGCLLSAGGTADHIHLLLRLHPENAVSDAMRAIKSNSSRWLRSTYPAAQGFAWQEGYGAFAVSLSALGEVKRYIANQAEHHRVQTFQEEFIEFLKRHAIAYDERHIWA